MTRSRPLTRRGGLLVAGAVLGVTAVGITGCSSSPSTTAADAASRAPATAAPTPGKSAASAPRATSAPTGTASPRATASPSKAATSAPKAAASAPKVAASSPRAAASSKPTSPGPAAASPKARASSASALTPVPGVAVKTLAPVALTQPASYGDGVVVQVSRVRSIEVKGRGIGEISGPAVAFTLQLRNSGRTPLPLGNVAVTASHGSADTPASPIESAPARPFPRSAPAGSTVTGTYVFTIPQKQRADVSLQVAYAAGHPVAVLTGAAR